MLSVFRRIVPLALLALVLASCDGRGPAPLIVGVNPWPGYEAFFIAQRDGLFSKAGLEVKLVDFESLGDARRAFERGQVDVVASTVTELLVSPGLSNRRPLAFYAVDFSNGADILLAKPEIKSVAALKGRRVAAEPGSVDILALHLALKSAGMKFSDIEYAPLSQSEIRDAYEKGEIDAAESYPPASSALEKLGAVKIYDSSHSPGFILDVLFADAQFVDSRLSDLRKLAAVFGEAQELLKKNANGEQAFIAARERVSEAEFRASLSGLVLLGGGDQLSYFGPQGKIGQVVTHTWEALLQTGSIRGETLPHEPYTDRVVSEAKG